MDPAQIALLVSMGLAAGFVAGLLGLGGGIIFAPVLLVYFHHTGVDAVAVSKLTAGSSLFCTLITALVSGWFQYREHAVRLRVALRVGLFSAAAVLLVTQLVTTQPWYDASVFQLVFSLLLVAVVLRMLSGRGDVEPAPEQEPSAARRRPRWPLLAGMGAGAGAIATAAGVGGGIVLVPAYNRTLRMPMAQATGTSSATIILISLVGVLTYAITGWGTAGLPASAVGYVDFAHAALLAAPAVLSARAGVWAAHYIDARALRWSFAVVAFVVAGRMLYGAATVLWL